MIFASAILYALLVLDLGVFAHNSAALHGRSRHLNRLTDGSLVKRAKRCPPRVPKPTSTSTKGQTAVAKPTTIKTKTTTPKPSPSKTEDNKPKTTDKPADDETKTTDKPKTTNNDDDKPKTSSSSADDAKPTSNAFSAFRALFPEKLSTNSSSRSWSTANGAPNHVDLSTSALHATNIMKLAHPVEHAPDGKEAFEISFKKGAYDFQGPAGGFSFFITGPDSVDLSTAKEATFAYRIFFQEGFGWQKGGKLPGLVGGESDSIARTCNGGNKDSRCFSARMMWRAGGAGELYAYLPPGKKGNSGDICNTPPESHCNPDYGSSLGRGAFHFADGGWTTVAQRVRLNDVGEANGEMQVFINGKSVIEVTGLTLRTNDNGRIRAAHVQSFFGGHDPSWASPRDQKMWFADFSVAITKTL